MLLIKIFNFLQLKKILHILLGHVFVTNSYNKCIHLKQFGKYTYCVMAMSCCSFFSPAGSRAASFEVPVTLDMGDCSAELGLTDTIGTVS